ncbi:LIM homeobox Lhx9 [Brachionus plicatilis]|uniref:LIM homeobox Lhx9 n=1 Tax=Brachionus plicatilis TaxID=10195 RepID=A0A3M7T5K1_BRAPC|nr:LIM homeobox Lhx9 [Brachionus plicatilis]
MGIQNICWICSGQIVDMYFLTVGGQFTIHLECLKCSVCLQKLEMQSKCFVRRGRFFCAEHYESEASCAGCRAQLMASDYVIRPNSGQLYHFSCFRCARCRRQIEPGSKHAIINEAVYCSQHYRGREEPCADLNNSGDPFRHDQSFSSSSVDSSPLSLNPQLKPLDNRSGSSGAKTSASGSTRKKRLRTSFKHQQLRIMKAHFQINQNPDSKDLKELSERTGLQKRVLQVWFQNSRAKQRKSSTGQYAMFAGIVPRPANSEADSKQMEDASYGDEDQESNEDENLEYDVDDELNESNSKSVDENYSNAPSEQTQYFNQQSIFDFYNCF